jgi:hypothetical protein
LECGGLHAAFFLCSIDYVNWICLKSMWPKAEQEKKESGVKPAALQSVAGREDTLSCEAPQSLPAHIKLSVTLRDRYLVHVCRT